MPTGASNLQLFYTLPDVVDTDLMFDVDAEQVDAPARQPTFTQNLGQRQAVLSSLVTGASDRSQVSQVRYLILIG